MIIKKFGIGLLSFSILLASSQAIFAQDAYNINDFVDNSASIYFPPIENQGRTNSCAHFSSTYYQATYMYAKAKGWNVNSDTDGSKKFSAKWSYNLTNEGSDVGSFDTYQTYYEQGIATVKDFKFDSNYKEWPTDAQVWKNAQTIKPDKFGSVLICDDSDTPIVNEKADTLRDIKQLLCDGYVLVSGTEFSKWKYKPIEAASSSENVGRAACYMQDGNGVGHAITIVGYDDDIWVDINKNGNRDDGEKGAFKIANSYGNEWEPTMDDGSKYGKGDGFTWVCYDALNEVSAVYGAPTPVEKRSSVFNSAFWMTFNPQSENNKLLLGEINISHPERNQLKYEIGCSEVNDSEPTSVWVPNVLNLESGPISLNGPLVFDYSQLLYGKDLSTDKKWYIKITDMKPDGKKAVIQSFKMLDSVDGSQTSCPQTNITLDDTPGNNSIILCVQHKLSDRGLSDYQWNYKRSMNPGTDIIYLAHEIFKQNGDLYAIAEIYNDRSKVLLLKYDPVEDVWKIFDENFGRCPSAGNQFVFSNNKLYSFDGSWVDIYNINTKEWNKTCLEMPLTTKYNFEAIEPGNGKIYIIGGEDSVNNTVNTIYEFDTEKYTWNTVSSMNYEREEPSVAALNGKVYIFGGRDKNGRLMNIVERFKPGYGCSCVSFLPEKLLQNRYNFKAVSLNDKIYLFAYSISIGKSIVYEYDPANNIWTEMNSIPGYINEFSAQAANGKIYLMTNNRNVLEFDPNIARVSAPTFNLKSGTYSTIQTVSIDCATSGATIRYTTDGSKPTSDSPIYSGPITVAGTKTIKACASKSGFIDSSLSSAEYTLSINVGDVNGDGLIDTADKLYLNRYTKGLISDLPVENDLSVGDLNGDNLIDFADVNLMDQYLIGKINSFQKNN